MSELGEKITPVVLTFNEEPNIRRTLDSLRWANRVIVVDSGSRDGTSEIVHEYENASWYAHEFADHLSQWTYAIGETGIESEYVLALDADMQVTPALLKEIEQKFCVGQFDGGLISFAYGYFGRQLTGSLCPPQVRLFRRTRVRIDQPNHTQRFGVDGNVYKFSSALIHDDQKPLESWVGAQLSYSRLNAKALANGRAPRLRDRLRRLGIMPPIMGLLAYLLAGGPLKGAAAARYAYERSIAEALLAIRMMDKRIQDRESNESARNH